MASIRRCLARVAWCTVVIWGCTESRKKRQEDSTRQPTVPVPDADSAAVVRTAIDGTGRRDTLVIWEVSEFRSDSLGHLVALVPHVRPEYQSTVGMVDGEVWVRVLRNGRARIVGRYRPGVPPPS